MKYKKGKVKILVKIFLVREILLFICLFVEKLVGGRVNPLWENHYKLCDIWMTFVINEIFLLICLRNIIIINYFSWR